MIDQLAAFAGTVGPSDCNPQWAYRSCMRMNSRRGRAP